MMSYKRTSKGPYKNNSLFPSQNTKKIILILIWGRGCSQPQGATICLEHRSDSFYKTRTTKEPYHILSYSYYLPVLGNHLCWIWWHRRKGKDRATHNSFFLSGLPYSSVSKSRMLAEYLCVSRSKIKTGALVLYSISNIMVKTTHASTSYKI